MVSHNTQKNMFTTSLPGVVTLCLLSISMYVWSEAKNTSMQAYQDYFDFRVREAMSNIDNRMATYQQVLHGTRGLFEASQNVSRTEFREYVFALNLEDNFPGVQGVGYSFIIPPGQKESHIAAVRKEGYAEYNIRPEGDRESLTSIVFLEPLADRNLRAFGYDMFSETIRRAAMERARDTGRPSMSGKVRLVQESGEKEQAGFLMYDPVYKNDAPHDTLSNRRDNVIGWVYSPFRMDDLMEGIFGELSHDIDVEIFDGEQMSSDTLMYDSNDLNDSNMHYLESTHSGFEQLLLANQTMEIAGHTWTVSIRALPSLYARAHTGSAMPVLIVGTAVSLLVGWLVWFMVTGRERALAAAREMNIQLIDSENTLQAVLDSSAIGVAWANESGEIEYINQKFTRMFGYTLQDVPTIDQWYEKAYPNQDYRNKIVTQWEEMVENTAQEGSHLPPLEAEIHCADGTVKHVVMLGSWAGKKLLVNFNDVTERKKSEELAIYMAHHDSLTGLANRHLFTDRLSQAVNLAKREKSLLAILFVDLDKFKDVNDTLGHETGDQLLIEVANRLQRCVRESDVVSRMGGDEFVVLMKNIEDEESGKLVGEKIRAVLNQPIIIDDHIIENSASIGIAMYPKHGDTQETLIRNADFAMYSSKKEGRNAVHVYRPDDH